MADDGRQDVVERDERLAPSDGHNPGEEEFADAAADEIEEVEDDIEERGAALLRDRRRVIALALAVVLLVVAIYVILPKVVGLEHAIDKLENATWYWIVAGVGCVTISFLSYATLFRSVLAGRDREDPVRQRLDTRASYQITMAGFVATVLFSAAGAGGVALTYWALRKAGMPRRRAACRMVAFVILLYSMYAWALIVFGVLLRTSVLPGDNPAGGTIVPAAIGGLLLSGVALLALVPEDAERRIRTLGKRGARWSRVAGKIASIPATLASGVRTAIAYLRHPKRQFAAIVGALGWWAGLIGVLWCSFRAVGVEVEFGVLVQGYFVGMVANLVPSPAAGVGTVDAGLIGAFVLFGIPAETVFPAILLFRLVSIWLPIPVGVAAYLQLRKTVRHWEMETPGATIKSKVTAAEAT
jgi:uncharacterized protein (TIRG00374 family)